MFPFMYMIINIQVLITIQPIERETIKPGMEWNQFGHACVLWFLSFSFECLSWGLNVALHHLLYTILLFLPK